MNKKKFIYLIVSLTLLCVVLAACAAIDGIRFEKEPRTVYVQGQDIDMTDTVLLALTGDKSEAVDLSQVQISG